MTTEGNKSVMRRPYEEFRYKRNATRPRMAEGDMVTGRFVLTDTHDLYFPH